MRITIYIVGLLIVFVIAGSIYVRYDTHRFIEESEKRHRPVPTNKIEPDSLGPQIELSQVDNQLQEIPEDHEEESIQFNEPNGTEKFDSLNDLTVPSDNNQSGISLEELDFNNDSETEENPVQILSPKLLTLQQVRESNRKNLIELHGDIPEVHTYLKYFPFEALLEGNQGKEYALDLSLKEHLEYQKAVAHLFPNEENSKNYLDALEMYEKFSEDNNDY